MKCGLYKELKKKHWLMAAALDQFSNHPVAQAIVRRATERGIDLSKFKVTDVMRFLEKELSATLTAILLQSATWS